MPRLFDDANTHSLLHASTPVTGAPLTIGGWIKDNDLADTEAHCILAIGNSGAAQAHRVQAQVQSDDTIRMRSQEVLTNDEASSIGAISADTWHLGAGEVAAADSRTAYLDGTAGTTTTTSVTPSGLDQISLGYYDRPTNAVYLSGILFWCFIYGNTIPQFQHDRLALGYEPTFCQRQDLKFFARLLADEDKDVVRGGTFTSPDGTPTVSNDFPPTIIRSSPRGRASRVRCRFA